MRGYIKTAAQHPSLAEFPVSTFIVGFSCIAVLLRRHSEKLQTAYLPTSALLLAISTGPCLIAVVIRFTF
jgi:uncharacterized membrane protein YoaK (UPF0700 family)